VKVISDGSIGRRVTSRRRDGALGAGLVAIFSCVLAATSWTVHTGYEAGASVKVVAGASLVASVGLYFATRYTQSAAHLLVFPLTLVAALVGLGLSTHGLATNYTGFLALAFVYIGLTQDPVAVPIFGVAAAPAWLICQDSTNTATFIKLATAVTTWLLIGWVLAFRAARDRAIARDLVDRANTDLLTQLPSRLALSNQISRQIDAPGRRVASLLVLDLDGFKSVNDTYGRASGDELLIAIAERLKMTFRADDVCARLGGGKFAVLLRDVSVRDAATAAADLLVVTAEPFTLSAHRVAVTASIGIAVVGASPHGQRTDGQSVVHNAELAMYEAKARGRNRVAIFQDAMHVRRAARVELETELRDGLERHQFELYYQPVVHMQTGAVIGTEALLRWNHPRRGLLAPEQFLGASEEIGIIVALGDWILREACRQAAKWQPADPARALTMAVNVSGPEMLAGNFVSRLRDILTETGLPGELLVLEITERMLISDAPLIRRRIEALKRLKVRVAIDDFGTGYSSLAYLREFPVDILKIDQSFVKPLGSDTQAAALLRSITAIADALNLDTVVEGVETQTQVEILTGLGCEVAQGFYFARPATVANIERYLLAGHRNVLYPRARN
jgi:diguanylate cyclase (GGDEF)-like protein